MPRDPGGYGKGQLEGVAGRTEADGRMGVRNAVVGVGDGEVGDGEVGEGVGGESAGKRLKEKEEGEDPWKRQRGGPSEEFQPGAWTPGVVKR